MTHPEEIEYDFTIEDLQRVFRCPKCDTIYSGVTQAYLDAACSTNYYDKCWDGPGYVVDHIQPLFACGPDRPSNMQWQTVEDAKAKDRWERRLRDGDERRQGTWPLTSFSEAA